MIDGNDNYYELFISMAIVSAVLCAIVLPIMGLVKLVQWMF
jgi:hypothetical protein